MFAVGTLGNYITQGVYSVSGPFHPFGGAVDIIVVQQKDGTFKSSPWYVKFGKFQGVLKRGERIVDVWVNDVPADFHMCIDHKGEAFFEKEVQYDEGAILALPSTASSRGESSELGKKKRLNYSKDSSPEGLEMQEVPNKVSGAKAAGLMNESNKSQSGKRDGADTAHVNSAETVRVPSDTPVNNTDGEVAVAFQDNNCSLVEEQNGTLSGTRKEGSKLERSGRRLAKLSAPIFGAKFGRKSEQASPDISSAQSLSLERAEMVADLLDRKWGFGSREILSTPRQRRHSFASATTDNSVSAGTGSLIHGSLGSGGVMNDATSGQSELGQISRPEALAYGSEQSVRDVSDFAETGSLTRRSESSTDVMNKASSAQSECGEFPRPVIPTEAFEQLTSENTTIDHSRAGLETSFTKRWEITGEERVLDSAAEKQTSILPSNESSEDVSPSKDSLGKPIHGGHTDQCSASHTGSEQVTQPEKTDDDVDHSTEGLPSPEVVLMSGDGHLIAAPVDVGDNHFHSKEFDSDREIANGASFSHTAASSEGDLASLESGRSKQPAVVSGSNFIRTPDVETGSGVSLLSGSSVEPLRMELPTGCLDGEVDAGKASECSSRSTEITSTKTTPAFVSEMKFKASEDNAGVPCHNHNMVVAVLAAVDKSWGAGEDCISETLVVRKLTTGLKDVDLQRESSINTDQSGSANGSLPDDTARDTRKLAHPSDNRLPVHMEAGSMIVTDVDFSRPNMELDSVGLESSSQPVLEQFYSFKEDNMAGLRYEDSEGDGFKDCLYLEELPNRNGDDNAVAHLDIDDPVPEKRHDEQTLPSHKAMASDLSEQALDARPGTSAWFRSKPIPIPQGAIRKKAELLSSVSLPCRLQKTEGQSRVYSRSVGSTPLNNVNPSHIRPDGNIRSDKVVDEGASMVDLVDMQVIKAIIYGSGKDSEILVNTTNERKTPSIDIELSLCRHLLSDGMGANAAAKVFASCKVTFEEFQHSGSAMFADDKLVVKLGERYFSWVEAAPYILDMAAAGTEALDKIEGGIAVEMNGLTKDRGSQAVATVPATTGWKLWPFSVRRSGRERGAVSTSNVPKQALLTATNLAIASPFTEEILRMHGCYKGSTKFKVRTYVPTSQQLASLRLKEGSNKISFVFSTPVLGKAQVDARIYLWNWNTRIVISDVDGTITRSDVLGQVMPFVGRDWTQSGVTRLFSAIKENGYEMLFLSARAISQAYVTRQFLLNLKQDGEGLPDGPVFISPDGLIPSFYREVIRRAPHEFKISCLEEIRELFPIDVNPFYAGFGNRDTDEISYLKVGIPKGKIFIINPKGEVVVNHLVDSKSYSSLHTLVNDMFPPMSSGEQEAFNSWNFWKLPLPDVEDELTVNSAKSTKRAAGSKRAG